MEAYFTADTSDFTRALRELAEIDRRNFPDVVRQAGRTLARELAAETFPLQLTAQSKKEGQLAVVRDIHRVYATPPQVYDLILKSGVTRKGSGGDTRQIANSFAKALANNDPEGALRILKNSGLDQRQGWSRMKAGDFDGGQEHRRRRSKSTGRVEGEKPTMLLTSARGLKKYENEMKLNAGSAKAAWAACSALLGSTRGFPAWVTKNMQGKGTVDNRLGEKDPSVTLRAQLGYESHALPPEGIARAQKFAAAKMLKMANIVVEKAVAKFNRRSY